MILPTTRTLAGAAAVGASAVTQVQQQQPAAQRERVITDANNRFVRFERLYDRPRTHIARAALTQRIEIARLWQAAPTPRDGWRLIRRQLAKARRATLESDGMLYDGYLD